MGQKLTEEQIGNWKKALRVYIGPAVDYYSDEEIQRLRDNLQRRIDEQEEKHNTDLVI